MMAVGRWKVYVVLFTALMAMYAAYALWSYMRRQENYTEHAKETEHEKEHTPSSDATINESDDEDKPLSKYRAKLYVLKVFDRKVHRKPDDGEIAKYAALGSKTQIYHAIVRDYNSDDDDDKSAKSDGDVSDCTDDDDEPPPPRPKKKVVQTDPNPLIDHSHEEPAGYSVPMAHCTLDHADDDGTPPEHSIAKKGERVCLDRKDVLTRLDTICAEIKQFRKVVEMM